MKMVLVRYAYDAYSLVHREVHFGKKKKFIISIAPLNLLRGFVDFLPVVPNRGCHRGFTAADRLIQKRF